MTTAILSLIYILGVILTWFVGSKIFDIDNEGRQLMLFLYGLFWFGMVPLFVLVWFLWFNFQIITKKD